MTGMTYTTCMLVCLLAPSMVATRGHWGRPLHQRPPGGSRPKPGSSTGTDSRSDLAPAIGGDRGNFKPKPSGTGGHPGGIRTGNGPSMGSRPGWSRPGRPGMGPRPGGFRPGPALGRCWGRGPCRLEDESGEALKNAWVQACMEGTECSWGPRTCTTPDGNITAYSCNVYQPLVLRHACNVTTPDGAVLRASGRPCCGLSDTGDWTQSSCDLGPLTLTCDDSRTVEAYFCLPNPPISQDGWFTGVLGDACRILDVDAGSDVSTRDCPATSTCTIGPLDFTTNDVNYQAFYCDVVRSCPPETSSAADEVFACSRGHHGVKAGHFPSRGPSRGPSREDADEVLPPRDPTGAESNEDSPASSGGQLRDPARDPLDAKSDGRKGLPGDPARGPSRDPLNEESDDDRPGLPRGQSRVPSRGKPRQGGMDGVGRGIGRQSKTRP